MVHKDSIGRRFFLAWGLSGILAVTNDVDETVRNNAIRALGVLAGSSPKVAERIPATGFVAMLNSDLWTDRNKAGFLLYELSRTRNPKLLGELRAQALDSLAEMARWKSSSHAFTFRILLGRIAGIEEDRLQQLVAAGEVDQIIKALSGTR